MSSVVVAPIFISITCKAVRVTPDFDLDGFLPYILNQAAEVVSRAFQEQYREEFNLSRAQWRVIAHLGKSGGLTAKEICQRSNEEKTTISRAVAALGKRDLLTRVPGERDRRFETLNLTSSGLTLFQMLGERAARFDLDLRTILNPRVAGELEVILRQLAQKGRR